MMGSGPGKLNNRPSWPVEIRVPLTYALVAGAWIWLSDSVVNLLVSNPEEILWLSIAKGTLFVMVTGSLLFMLLRRAMRQIREMLEELSDSEMRFRSLVLSLPDPMVIIEAGAVVFANSRAAELFGVTPDASLIGRRLEELIDPGTEVPVIGTAVCRMRRLNGDRFDSEVSAIAIDDGGRPALQLLLRDVSARRRMEAELASHRANLEQLVAERTTELRKEIEERGKAEESLQSYADALRDFNQTMVDREMRMIELKEEVNRLCLELGRPLLYPPVWNGKPD
jgi:PAS domain S-box-containing protein